MCTTGNRTNVVITQITKLPIIHIKNHIIITDTRDKVSILNNSLYYTKHTWVDANIKTEPSLYLAQQPIIYDYK